MAYAFRNQVEEQQLFGSASNRLGIIGGMTCNGVSFNILPSAFADRFEMVTDGYNLFKEAYIDVLRDDYTYAFFSGVNVTWAGIRKCGLYAALALPQSQNKRPSVMVGQIPCQVFAMHGDDPVDPTVKLLVRRQQ
jgi:hypothetical protein